MTVDILIRGGSVFDGGGGPPVHADIAIRGDRIIAVGRDVSPQSAHRVVEARGLAICPGFVDIHSHSDYHLLLTPTAESAKGTFLFWDNRGHFYLGLTRENRLAANAALAIIRPLLCAGTEADFWRR